MPNFTGKSGGGPHHMKKGYATGKNPIPMLGDLNKDNKMSRYESKRQDAIEKNTKPGPPMYDTKGTMAQKYKTHK